ncbi:Zinc/iron permease [Cunninghamella echinulata]|nr:Zinc/iron permease [Cunninghamella echinulata]
MFISNETSTELGVSIGLAICIHNLIEGAMIALPIYYATKSRTMAFLYAAILGGASQPIGALIGLFLIDSIYEDDYLFGILFAIVSGMMLYIAIQSMLPQAMKADQRYVTSFFFVGIFIVGLVSLFNAE